MPSLSAGGAERVIINLANAFTSNADVYLAVIKKAGKLTNLVNNDVRRLDLLNKFLWIFRIIWYVHTIKPCCLIATNFDINASLLAIKFLLPKSCAIIIREPVSVYATRSESRIPALRFFIFKYLYPFTDILILLSNEMKEEFVQLCPRIAQKIKVVSNGVNLSRIEHANSSPSQVPVEDYIISVCRLEYQKGLDVLIDAFQQVVKAYPDYRLLLVGSGSQYKKLLKQINDLSLQDKIQIMGFVDNPLFLVKSAKLFILSSRYEGMSNSMLEALCLGVPVVAVRKHTGASEIIQDNVSGYLVNECNAQDLGNVMLQALQKVKSLNRIEISQWACNEYSQAKMIKTYLDILGEYCAISRN